MKRRKFLGSTALLSLYAAIRPGHAAPQAASAPDDAPADDWEVDSYFLDTGEVSQSEQDSVADFEQYQDRIGQGKEAIMPRGGRPRRAPTFRFLHWNGDLSGSGGELVSPLAVEPMVAGPRPEKCALNAEILGFHACTEDFPKKSERGTLTVELRGVTQKEKMSWMYVQQFDVYDGGATDLGMEHIAQADKSVELEEPTVDVRLQLMRHSPRGGFLHKVLKVAGMLNGVRTGKGRDRLFASLDDATQQAPALRIPKLPKEGVALGQAVLSGITKERPLWASGYNAYSLTDGGGRLKITPGIWVAIDESRVTDTAGINVADRYGRIVLTRDGEPIDANYLILDFKIGEAGA